MIGEMREGRSVQVTGPSGSGRTTLCEELRQSGDVVLMDLLPAYDVDCAAVATVEAMAILRGAKIEASRSGKPDYHLTGKQIANAARDEHKFLIVRLPASWSTSATIYGPSEGGAESTQDGNEQTWIKNAARWLGGLLDSGIPIGIVSDVALQHGEFGFKPTHQKQLAPCRVDLENLIDVAWGSYRSAYSDLLREVEDEFVASPIEWRLAVGLVALGEPIYSIKKTLRESVLLASLAEKFASILQQLPNLLDSVRGFIHIRRPMQIGDAVKLFDVPVDHHPLFAECLAYGSDGVVHIASALRNRLAKIMGVWPGTDPLWQDKIAEAYQNLDGAPEPSALSFDQARAWCEKNHHAAYGQVGDLWDSQEHLWPEHYWERGRSLSFRKDYEQAADTFLDCTLAFPEDQYSWHYLAWNLYRAGGPGDAVEMAYRKAIDLDPSNAWWNSRLITFFIETKQFSLARDEWRRAVGRVDPGGERMRGNPWLGTVFYRWVADAWVKAEQFNNARETIALVPSNIISQFFGLLKLKLRLDKFRKEEPANDLSTSNAHNLARILNGVSADGSPEKAIEQLIEQGRVWIEANEIESCNEALRLADPTRLNVTVALAMLVTFLPIKGKVLKNFKNFATKLEMRLQQERPNDVESLMDGLS